MGGHGNSPSKPSTETDKLEYWTDDVGFSGSEKRVRGLSCNDVYYFLGSFPVNTLSGYFMHHTELNRGKGWDQYERGNGR